MNWNWAFLNLCWNMNIPAMQPTPPTIIKNIKVVSLTRRLFAIAISLSYPQTMKPTAFVIQKRISIVNLSALLY